MDGNVMGINELYQRKIAERDKKALRSLLATKEGRWFLIRLIERTQLYSRAYRSETNDLLIFEGRRRVGLELINDIADLGEEELLRKQLAEREYINVQKECKLAAEEEYEDARF